MDVRPGGRAAVIRSGLSHRRDLALFLGLILVALLLPFAPASAAPAPWPSVWNPYPSLGGGFINDIEDSNPGYSDISNGGGATALPSVYIANDGTNAFFRFRVTADPTGGGGLASTAYLV